MEVEKGETQKFRVQDAFHFREVSQKKKIEVHLIISEKKKNTSNNNSDENANALFNQ